MGATGRWWMPRPFGVLLGVLLLAPSSVGAGQDTGARAGAAAFGRGLTAVQARLDAGHWQAGLDDLRTLLDVHAQRPYVALRLEDIRATQIHATFKLGYVAPHPRELVAGTLSAWDPESGALTLRYTGRPRGRTAARTPLVPETAPPSLRIPRGDFETAGDSLIHPVQFDGPYTITVRGRRLDALRELPPAWRLRSARVLVGRSDNGHHEVLAGFPGGGHGKIRVIDLDDRRQLDDRQRDNLDLTDVGDYRFVVKVGPRRITASLDGVAFLSAENERGRLGGWGLSGFPHVSSVEVSGDSDGRWIGALLATHERAARAAFEAGYDPDDDLPRWLVGTSAAR